MPGPLPSSKLYKIHVLNLREVESGIVHTERALRADLARQADKSAETHLKILLLLTGAWAECRLKKLLYEPSGFEDADRFAISSGRSQLDWWYASLETGYRKRYNVPKAKLSESTLKATSWMRYCALQSLIHNELKPVIEMRNTLAHGQWARALNSDSTNISSVMMIAIRSENALSARFKRSLIENLSNLIHDLVSSKDAFERDYDVHYKHVVSNRQNLEFRSYESWRRKLVEKYQRGRSARDKALIDKANRPT